MRTKVVANILIAVGGAGIITGMGGKYFFVIPVMAEDKGATWGYGRLFDTRAPSLWTGPLAGQGTTEGTLFTASGPLAAMWGMTGQAASVWGLDKLPNSSVYGWPTSTQFSFGNKPGTLGVHAPWVFLGMLGTGLLLRIA